MERVFNLFTVSCFLAAQVGLTLIDRSLLLTDTYKFPYPLAVTFVQLLFTACLGFLVHLLVRAALPQDSSLNYDPLPYNKEVLPTARVYSPWRDDTASLGSRRSSDSSQDAITEDNELSHSTFPPHDRLRCIKVWEQRFQSNVKFVYTALAIVLVIRHALGNVLLSHLPFPTYTLILIAALPWSWILNYHGESVSRRLLAAAGALALCFASVPLARTFGLANGILAVLVSLADAILAHLMCKAAQRHWHRPDISVAGTRHGDIRSVMLGTIKSYSFIIGNTCWTLAIVCGVAALLLLPAMSMLGELQDMARNSYVTSDPPFWHRVIAGTALQASSLLCYTLIALKATPSTMTSLQLPLCSIVVAVLYHSRLTPQAWIHLSLCWIFCLVRALQSSDDQMSLHSKSNRSFCAIARKVFLASVFYAAIYQGSYTIEEYVAAGTISLPIFGAVKPKGQTVVNASPVTLTGVSNATRDDYLGPRPPAGMYANMDHIMGNCADSADGTGVEDIVHCLSYLNASEDKYFSLPSEDGSQLSQETPSPLLKKLQTAAVRTNVASTPSKGRPLTSQGTCEGPITPFHTYWTGPATWRFELFIKAYLYTQNLACSRLWIWLDSDIDTNVLEKMLYHDTLFQRFQGLLNNGYILLKQWTMPQRILLPPNSKALERASSLKPSEPDAIGEVSVADGAIQDASGQLWLVPNQMYKVVSTPTQVSDLVRFVVLHLHGGVYLDLDVLLLRDLRPLLLPNPASDNQEQPAWAEQWVERANNPGDYNTAVLSLPANSSLSSYILRGGLRMGMNFHPKIIGRMLWKEGRNGELAMLHNAFFDPLVTNLRRKGTDVCTVPCHKNFESSFMGIVDEPDNEWSNYGGETSEAAMEDGLAGLRTNRTMEHFFRGAFAYHIHNQWKKFPEQASWMDVITQAQDGFFAGKRTNAYGEVWGGPPLEAYDRSEWGWGR